jgi:hypothetical protein
MAFLILRDYVYLDLISFFKLIAVEVIEIIIPGMRRLEIDLLNRVEQITN